MKPTSRNELASFATGLGLELGVAGGHYSAELLKHGQDLKLYSVDRWTDAWHHHGEYLTACERLNDMALRSGNESIVLRMTFDEAAALFVDASFDFIYIDGYAHTGQEEGRTLDQYWPKLKPGGIFAGHDYCDKFPKTIAAVDAFVAKHQLALNVILDGDYPSWWVRKP